MTAGGCAVLNLGQQSEIHAIPSTTHQASQQSRPTPQQELVAPTLPPEWTVAPTKVHKTATPLSRTSLSSTTTPEVVRPSIDELDASYPPIAPVDLYSYPKRYIGERFRITGEIVNIERGVSEGQDFIVLNFAPNIPQPPSGATVYQSPMLVYFWGTHPDIKINSVITVYGVGDGIFSGTNIAGGKFTTPQIAGEWYEIK